MAATFIAIAFAGVLMLPHVKGPTWLRWLGRVLAGVLALALSWAAISLYQFGAEKHWTGDGPGMLVVMLAIPVAGICALAAWFGLLWPSASRNARLQISPWIAIGMIALGIAGTAKSAHDYGRELRHAHDAPVVALQLVDGGTRLVSIDAAGRVMRWKVAERDLIDTRELTALAGAREVRISSDGRFAVAFADDGARIVPLDGDAPASKTLPGVAQMAMLANGEAAFAHGNEVRIVSLAAPDVARKSFELPAEVTTLAATAQGQLFVALADGSIVMPGEHGEPDRTLAHLPNAARRLVASPGGRTLVALDAESHPTFLSIPNGDLRQADTWVRMHALAFVNEDQLVFTTSKEDPSALAFSLERFQTEPFFNHGQTITALAAAPGAADAAIALGGDLHLVPAPAPGLHAYASSSVRLVQRSYF